jgi:hypothetical protein
MSPSPDPESPFARVQSPREKGVTLFAYLVLLTLSASLPLLVDLSLREFHTWLSLYGIAFFGAMSLHSWRSIRNNWSVREDNVATVVDSAESVDDLGGLRGLAIV